MRLKGFSAAISLAAIAIGVLALPLPISTEARAQALEYNTDRPGQDYSSFDLPAADPALCQTACLADPQCQAFSYVHPGVQGASARCWLKNSVPDAVASDCCVSGVRDSGTPPAAGGQFPNPMFNGYAVDICLNWGVNCGKPAADEFCRQNGFAESSSHTIQNDAPPTLVLGDNAICAEGFCDRFSEIICTSGTTPPPLPPIGNVEDLWRTTATAHRDAIGQTFTYDCPPIGTVPAVSVWGTNVYTDDSAVCVAAVHAGVITPGIGGTVTIEMSAGLSEYAGSVQNGVTSSGYGSWPASYVFAGSGPGIPGGQTGGGAYPPSDEAASASAQSCEGPAGTQCVYGCPPGFPLGSSFWGTGTYTDDSSVCNAAVHAGVITQAGGGWVTIFITDGQASYPASTQNGVTSSSWGEWGRSFTFAGVAPGGNTGIQAGGPCANPRTQQVMDEWLGRAIPTAEGNLRYESWGRAVGTTPSAVITAPNPPDTHLSRCEYLLQQAPGLGSRNIGTLYDYLLKNGVI